MRIDLAVTAPAPESHAVILRKHKSGKGLHLCCGKSSGVSGQTEVPGPSLKTPRVPKSAPATTLTHQPACEGPSPTSVGTALSHTLGVSAV